MKKLFETARQSFAEKKPFVIYSKPNQAIVDGIFQQSGKSYFLENFTQEGFVFAPFSGEKKLIIPKNDAIFISEEFFPDENFEVDDAKISEEGKIAFETLVKKALIAIQEKNFEKVVLSRKEILPKKIDAFKAFANLLQLYPTAFRYLFYHPEAGIWTGATPEQLLKVENNNVQTVALAGTQVFKEDIIWEEKEKEEQLFVTQFITENLKDFTSNIQVSEPKTIKAGNLAHIKTEISAQLESQASLTNIVDFLHPTPAVCGFPKEKAKKFIVENEDYEREYYSGFLGELNWNKNTESQVTADLYVNLRCMKVSDSQMDIFVGCGITAQSNAEKEFYETANKALTIKKALTK
ncbi:isochorismate synthase [Flavobacterium sp. NST-5]|uniref:isochorismate synthase n=1 Tax=Flavobacterium ichthyis TaxID=2698827 RepID=A0ABW9Z5V7_9FLAO|nr:isochorismate synthase [Flavobacterium ichthyis]NBL63952.1 isochorismate synthase [Flavobacterium ichthyis]